MKGEKSVDESSNIVTQGMIQRHPSERGGRRQRYVVLYSCCCCCCCCLHSIGGAIGALAAGDEPIGSPSDSKPGFSVQGLYWSSFVITTLLSAVGLAIYLYFNGKPFGSLKAVSKTPIFLAWGLLFFGPAWLLAAGLVAGIRLALRRDVPNPEQCQEKLGDIVWMSIFGAVIGIGVMFVMLIALFGRAFL